MSLYARILLIFSVLHVFVSFNLKRQSLDSVIDKLYKTLQNEQARSHIPYRAFPPRWEEDKGMYRSYIHVNWVDQTNSFISTLIRNQIKVIDSNNFVTSFVLMNILEAYELDAVKIDEQSFREGLDFLLNFKDKNYGQKSPVYTFWKQIYMKEKGIWSQYPGNMNKVVDTLPNFSDRFINSLKWLHLDGLADFFATYNGLREGFLYAYRIPSDADDTSVNLGLTGRLNKFKELKNFTSNWTEENTNFTELFDTLKRYAYRPFINQSRSSVNFSEYCDIVDTRSYFVLHDFLVQRLNESKTQNKSLDIVLPSTWLSDIPRQRLYSPFIGMPFSVNNIDHNVAINFLFGVTNFVLFHKNQTEVGKLFDDEMKNMFSSTVDLVIYSIKKNTVNKRPDLSLVYYPSVFDFYWLCTRVYSLINTHLNLVNSRDFEYFRQVRDQLEIVLINEANQQLISKAIKIDNNTAVFQEFLGNAGNYTRGEDRLFSTGLALNSLLNIWTSRNSTNGTFYYIDNTPSEVKSLVDQSANYIINNINRYFTSKENTFFSGSVKNSDTFPTYYPGNYFKFLNGTDLPALNTSYITNDVVFGTRVIEDKEFQKDLNQTWFGRIPPQEFSGFNQGPFPYWSSPAMTYSVNLVGLAKYRLLAK